MMKKLYFFLGTLIASIFFFSCSNFDKRASLSFVIPTNFSRTITNGDADNFWKLKVSLSGEINKNKEMTFSENDFEKEVVFENLEVGKNVTIDVSIFNGEKRFYKTESPQSIKLVSGDNFVNIKLIRETSSEQINVSDKIPLIIKDSKDGIVPYKTESKVVLDTTEKFESYQWYLNENLLECTEKEFNFIPAENDYIELDNSNILRCVFSDGTKIYFSETEFTVEIHKNAVYSSFEREDGETSKTVFSVADYKNSTAQSTEISKNTDTDTDTDTVYCLDENSDLYMIYYDSNKNIILNKYSNQGETEELQNFANTITQNQDIKDISYDVSRKFLYILAENGDTATAYAFSTTEKKVVYNVRIPTIISDSSYRLNQIAVYENNVYVSDESNIFKMSFTVSGEIVTPDTPELVYSLTDKFTSGSPKITDLQIGDGCGNHTETLYALVRDVSFNGNTSVYYSRGGLVGISTSDSNSKGYTDASFGKFESVFESDVSSSYDCELYAPRETSTNEFFGPTRFVAVVPKKLVIFDNGFVFADNNGTGKIPVTYKNSFIEFDIKDATLTRCPENKNISSDVEEVSFPSSYFITN